MIKAHDDPAERAVFQAESFVDRIVQDVLEGLRAGRYRRGERLIEADFTHRHGVARGPVREAFARLAADGIVQAERHRGAHIRVATRDNVIESLELLELALGLAARRAARAVKQGEPPDAIKTALIQVLGFTSTDSSTEHGVARQLFFDAIIQLSGSIEIARIAPGLQFCMVGAAFEGVAVTINAARHDEFRAIAAAIESGNPAKAETATRRHVARAIAVIRKTPAVSFGHLANIPAV